MLRLHVVHLLDQGVRHATSLEDRVGQARISGIGNSFMVDHILDWELLEKLLGTLLLPGGLQVRLLHLLLLSLEDGSFSPVLRFLVPLLLHSLVLL